MMVYVVIKYSAIEEEGASIEAVYVSREKAEAHEKRLDRQGKGMSQGAVEAIELIE